MEGGWAGCHHLLATCTPHSSNINLSHAQQCKAAFHQVKRALARYINRHVQVMPHAGPGHRCIIMSCISRGYNETVDWSGKVGKKMCWKSFPQLRIVILIGCLFYNLPSCLENYVGLIITHCFYMCNCHSHYRSTAKILQLSSVWLKEGKDLLFSWCGPLALCTRAVGMQTHRTHSHKHTAIHSYRSPGLMASLATGKCGCIWC